MTDHLRGVVACRLRDLELTGRVARGSRVLFGPLGVTDGLALKIRAVLHVVSEHQFEYSLLGQILVHREMRWLQEYGTANYLYDTGQARDGWRRIEVLTRSARAVGWAPPESVAVGVVNMSGYGEGGGSFGATDVPRVVLPEGTWIRVPGEREPFARTVCDTTLPIRGEPGATVAVEIRSPWGWLSGEVTCARPEGSEMVWRCG